MITNDTIWSEKQTPITVTADVTTITLQSGISLYEADFGSTDTELVFSTSAIAGALTAGGYNVITFELLVKMWSTVQTVDFPENVSWLNNIPPTMNAANKTYLLLFRSYDGGESWIGTQEGSWNS